MKCVSGLVLQLSQFDVHFIEIDFILVIMYRRL